MDTIARKRQPKPEIKIRYTVFASPHESLSYKKGNRYYLASKRAVDIILSIILIVSMLSWLFPILYVIISLSSKGGGLFVQKRVGRNGKIFKCFKFRTMVVNREADFKEAAVDDARITKIGKFLRNTYLDELPQLINVLVGDMSIIGPRPHMVYHDRQFSKSVPYYLLRHSVKPGMTGLAQVKGYIGSATDFQSIYGRTKLDVFYVRQQSAALDIKILTDTVLFIVSNKNAK